jgi:predicted transcriptional regulator
MRDAELVDAAVEGIGDAAHVAPDAKSSRVEIDGLRVAHLRDTGAVQIETLVVGARVLVVGADDVAPGPVPECARDISPQHRLPRTSLLAPGTVESSTICQSPPCALPAKERSGGDGPVAEHSKEEKQEEARSVAKLTTEIVVAYIIGNTIAPADLGDLIGSVSRALDALGREQPEPVRPKPAVPVRRSILDSHLVCLLCGKRHRILRRHLELAHQLTPDAYREQFGLKPDYPMTAPGYSRQRAEMAKRVGLGRREKQAPPQRRKPRRGGRSEAGATGGPDP